MNSPTPTSQVPSFNTVVVTGGAGFIGSALVRHLLALDSTLRVVSFDALTYAGKRENLEGLTHSNRHQLIVGDIADDAAVKSLLATTKPDALINAAAETHVDRSNIDARPFARTNVLGTQVLLEHARIASIPMIQVSTDEVFGSLEAPHHATTSSPLNPTNPYAASKAAAELLALAAFKTHEQDVRITRCTNNYGPRQDPEKFIPLMTKHALEGKPLPVYGDGMNVRDWIHVDDHAAGIAASLYKGTAGSIYHFTANEPKSNLEVVAAIIERTHAKDATIEFVKDRPAHDRRYSIDDAETREALGWAPKVEFDDGLWEISKELNT